MPVLRTKLLPGAALGAFVFGAAALVPLDEGHRGPAPNVVTVVASDFAFHAPDTVPAGVTEVRLENQGPSLHHVWLLRFDAGKGLADLMKVPMNGPPPAWVHDAGGPNAAAPGAQSSAIVKLEPGRYAIVCFVPDAKGQPHIMLGMAKELVVIPAKSAAAMPTADITLTLRDYSFTESQPITGGHHVIRVRNEAAQTHEVVLFQLAEGKSPADVAAWAEHQEGPPPGMPMGGVSGLAPGGENDFMVNLAPGRYGFICFVPDAKDGKPHFVHGMTQEFTVR